MYTNSYIIIKDFIYNKLISVDGILPKEKITYEIENTKDLIMQLGPKTFAQILSANELEILTDDEWSQMKREFETHFDVEMEAGVLIQGIDQMARDTTWWTSNKKQTKPDYYWSRYKKLLFNDLPPEVVKVVDEDTDVVMNNIEDPEVADFSRYGMVVGHVQSGKTGNYAALVCKAADAGYKFIVIITGGKNNLRNQTQERINEAFVGVSNGAPVGVGKFGNLLNSHLPVSLTSIEQDFKERDAKKHSKVINFDNISTPIVMVIKKISPTLTSVNKWIHDQSKNGIYKHAVLVIDDESDYASINTGEEDDPAVINSKIREMLSYFSKSTYVAYTATPFANIFIDHEAKNEKFGDDLFPKDFIYALDAPSNYFGAKKIFLDDSEQFLVKIDDYKPTLDPKHKKDDGVEYLPNSMEDAMIQFCINVAIRNLRGHRSKHNSMLIHISRYKNIHRELALCVERFVTDLKNEFISYGALKNGESLSKQIKHAHEVFNERLSINDYSWDEIRVEMSKSVESIIVREVHSKSKVPLEYRKDTPTNVIVIGGESLSRGYTLEGLSVSYFIRSTVYYDTLMQMGRWFGYRVGYEDLCRIYMPDETVRNYQDIIVATQELIEDLKIMSDEKRTPYDFGLSVVQYPDTAIQVVARKLQITAKNKQKNAMDYYLDMSLDGRIKECSFLPADFNCLSENINTIDRTIRSLENHQYRKINGNYLWEDVNKVKVKNFINEFCIYKRDVLGIASQMPIAFIKKYIYDRNTNWDIALYGGELTKQMSFDEISIKLATRKIQFKGDRYEISNRSIATGSSESIALPDELRNLLGSNRRAIRQHMKRPLLMLHVFNSIDFPGVDFAAFGVSFPGDSDSSSEPVKLRINTVYYKNLIEEIELGGDSDD